MTRSRMEYILKYCSIEELRVRWLHYMQQVNLRNRHDSRVANTRENQDYFPDSGQMRQQILDRVFGPIPKVNQQSPINRSI